MAEQNMRDVIESKFPQVGVAGSLDEAEGVLKKMVQGNGEGSHESSVNSTRQHWVMSEDEQPYYDFTHFKKRGLALIIVVSSAEKMKRKGSEKDVESCCSTFFKLGFQVLLCLEFDREDLLNLFKKVAVTYNHDQASCFICTTLAHGSEMKDEHQRVDYILAHDYLGVSMEEIFTRFSDSNCQGLQNKPRIFFFQCCRGDNDDLGIEKSSGNTETPSASTNYQYMPFESAVLFPDFLAMYASAPGYKAKRNHGKGTRFIQSLCNILDQNVNTPTNLLTLLTQVQSDVANKESSKKQIPVVDFSLTREIYLSHQPHQPMDI